jgi:hypothetical protein
MTLTQNFFTDVLTLVKGDNLYCELQSSDDNLMKTVKEIDGADVVGDYSATFPLNEKAKKMLIDNIMLYNSEEDIHRFEIQSDGRLLFIAYDGFEIANIVSDIQLPENFIRKYLNMDLCYVVDEI